MLSPHMYTHIYTHTRITKCGDGYVNLIVVIFSQYICVCIKSSHQNHTIFIFQLYLNKAEKKNIDHLGPEKCSRQGKIRNLHPNVKSYCLDNIVSNMALARVDTPTCCFLHQESHFSPKSSSSPMHPFTPRYLNIS